MLAAGFGQVQKSQTSAENSKPVRSPAAAYVGDEACASCHKAIYDSYQRTSMAHGSGPALEGLKPADFVHPKSRVHYRIYSEAGKVWLSYERPGDPGIGGKKELLYFIGSGHRGRTYLFSVDDFFFESPVNWYANRQVWDMAPAYGDAREIPLNLPAYASCLECHSSGMRPPANGTENKYSMPLFAQNGVGCERCHGPGADHLRGGPMVNPAKLAPERRDSICMQCHLEGSVAIERSGHHLSDFRPGDRLDDFVHHYVLTSDQASGLGANSQFEALAQSACKKKSGDAMSCASCHDPHDSPAKEQRASYFRGKCLACHGAAFGAKHHADRPDCTACHMPASLSADISHTEVTDHRIQRRPATQPQLLQDFTQTRWSAKLMPFPDSREAEEDVRDQALAWQSLARSGTPDAAAQADRMLHKAAQQTPTDPEILAGLAFVELKSSHWERARDLYRKALQLDPNLIEAAANLGVIEARSGNAQIAVKLWQGAFERAPANSAVGMNLARTFCESRQINEARMYVQRVLRFNPDLDSARRFGKNLDADPVKCEP
jgi:tetratricopeptide (TPR) repeat protein